MREVTRRRRKRRAAGLTLMEIMIAIAILGLLVAVAVPGVQNVTRANLKHDAGKLAAAIRYLYNHAVTQNQYCRLVIDLDQAKYSGECTDEPFYLRRELEEARDGARDEDQFEDEKEAREALEDSDFGMNDAERQARELQYHTPEFAAIDNDVIKATELNHNVYFDGIWTGHQRDRFTKGSAYLYFFHEGFVEPATIHLIDDREQVYTLEVIPLSGRVKVTAGYKEAPVN